MKKILALVDFSDVSVNALSFAAELSKRASARLIIMNVLKKGEDEVETRNKLKSVELDLKKSFDSDLNCEAILAHGNLVTTLKKIIAAQRPDLIVMGTKGASGLKRILIGSNTVNVIAKTKLPVLVIPEVARFENFINKGKNRIILATDLDSLENKDAINILIERHYTREMASHTHLPLLVLHDAKI